MTPTASIGNLSINIPASRPRRGPATHSRPGPVIKAALLEKLTGESPKPGAESLFGTVVGRRPINRQHSSKRRPNHSRRGGRCWIIKKMDQISNISGGARDRRQDGLKIGAAAGEKLLSTIDGELLRFVQASEPKSRTCTRSTAFSSSWRSAPERTWQWPSWGQRYKR